MGLTLTIDGAIADPAREAAFVAAVKELITGYVDDLSTVTITTDHSGSPDLLAEIRAEQAPPPAGDPPPPPLPVGDPGTPAPGTIEERVGALETTVAAIATQVNAIATAVGADTAADTATGAGPGPTFPPAKTAGT